MSFKPRYILAEEAEERIVALYRKERGDAAEIFNTAIDACQSIILDMYDNAPAEVAHQVCILYAVVNGWLNTVDVDKIPEFEKRLAELMETRYENALVSIRETGKLEEAAEESIKEALKQLLSEMGG